MKIKRISLILIVSSFEAAAQWLQYPTAGVPRLPNGKPNLLAPPPVTADGKPDFSGMWEADKTGATANTETRSPLPVHFRDVSTGMENGLPYRPWARELALKRQAENQRGSPDGLCLPLGVVWSHSHPTYRKYLQMPGLLTILIENNTDFRQIFTDGRPLPVDPQPSYYGYSSAKWEANTLVVETIGFREDLWADFAGNPITDQAKVTERFRRQNFGTLNISITVDDPKAYTAPWTIELIQHIVLDTEFLPSVCLENERDRSHLVGN